MRRLRSPLRGRRPPRLTALLVLALAGLGAAVWWTVTLHGPRVTEGDLAGARAAARQVALDVSSYDYRKIDQQFATVAASTTGQALSSFQKDKGGISSYVTSNKIVTTATVSTDAAVPGASRDAATVLVGLTVSTTVAGKQANVGGVLVELGMVRDGGTWRAATIT